MSPRVIRGLSGNLVKINKNFLKKKTKKTGPAGASKKRHSYDDANLSPASMKVLEENPDPFDVLQNDFSLRQQVVLQMALEREPMTAATEGSGDVSPVIADGFFWRDYPVLENILYDSMAQYYKISLMSRQSKYQQAFNNTLVEKIRSAAQENGLAFHATFYDKKLRDRIRCFFKTHLQNAKKRLVTLYKHPDSPGTKLQLLRMIAACRDEENHDSS